MKRIFLIFAFAVFFIPVVLFAGWSSSRWSHDETYWGSSKWGESTGTTGTYWLTARTAYWTNTRVALWTTARNTEIP